MGAPSRLYVIPKCGYSWGQLVNQGKSQRIVFVKLLKVSNNNISNLYIYLFTITNTMFTYNVF